ncbi:MAG: 50S ribosomal protein L21 [Myxococcota bacterium]|nr:50S ribosomal protein L21 [Myxococcota bacterium]
MAATYAIIKTGGKQYRVSEGDRLRVEKLPQSEGEVSFDEVLLVGGEGETKIGAPRVEGATVSAKILAEGRGKKILIFKKNRRKGYHKKQGHRQSYTELQVTRIQG